MRYLFLLILLLVDLNDDARAAGFSSPVRITDGAAKYQISRTADHVMAFDSTGTLHATYWSGRIVTNPAFPSYIYYRTWTLGDGWTPQVSIDDSVVSGEHIGGRHPSLAILPDDTVWIVWQDHRDSTPAGSWIDNLEIYGDYKTTDTAFSATDIRLTNSPGNGYAPKIAARPGSFVLSVCWHDFESDGLVSDIFVKTSDASGVFNLSESMASMHVTDRANRGNTPLYSLPDIAVDGSGARHMVWTGGEASGVNLYYASSAEGGAASMEQLLATGGTDYFNPPHITTAANGDVWISYGDNAAPSGENVVLLRRRSGQPAFDPRVDITSSVARQYSPDHEVDALGRVHIVWIDERLGRHIYYAIYDPGSGLVSNETKLTTTAANWTRPTILLDSAGEAYVPFEEDRNPGMGDLWFTTTARINAAPDVTWTSYE